MSESDELHYKVKELEERVKELEKADEVLYPFMEEARVRILALELVLRECLRALPSETQLALYMLLQHKTLDWIDDTESSAGEWDARALAERLGRFSNVLPVNIGDD